MRAVRSIQGTRTTPTGARLRGTWTCDKEGTDVSDDRRPEPHSLGDGAPHGDALSTIGWPVLLGLAVTLAFYLMVFNGPLNMPLATRYFAGHPVAYLATAMFFIGVVALFQKFTVLSHRRR